MDDGKALDLVAIDLRGRASFADYLVIATGTSARHVTALAENLSANLRQMGIRSAIEGKNGDGNWVVLDLTDVIVHLFNADSRKYYDLEGMWK